MRLSEIDAKSVEAFRQRAKTLKAQGRKKEAWQLDCYASQLISQTTIRILKEGDLKADEELYFLDLPKSYPEKPNQGIQINLLLIKDSPLTKDILAVLEKHLEVK